jgi:hypothetical protein
MALLATLPAGSGAVSIARGANDQARGNDTKMGQKPGDTAWEMLHHRSSKECEMTRGMGTYN